MADETVMAEETRVEAITVRPGKYQVMPPLTGAERASLKAAIERDGQIEPVEVDETGEIINGHSRYQIALELGIPCPFRVVRFPDEAAKLRYAYVSNVARRQLDPLRWGLAFKGYLAACGVRRGPGRQAKKAATRAAFAREWGVSERTARERLALADRFTALPDFIRRAFDPALTEANEETLWLHESRARQWQNLPAELHPARRVEEGTMTSATNREKPRGAVVGRIVPKNVAGTDGLDYIADERVASHPLVTKARAQAEGLLDEARRKGVRLVAEAYASAVRALHNEVQLARFNLNGTFPRTVR